MTKIVQKYLQQQRKDELKELADFVLEEYCDNQIININDLLQILDISICFGNYSDSFDGLLECINDSFHIYCNLDRLQSKYNPRTRFTITHELGHFFIQEHRDALLSGKMLGHCSFSEYQSNDLIEQEADFFASNLLLPEILFLKSAKKKKKGFDAIISLANEFKVSITSTAIRYVSLNILPCMLIKWSKDGYNWKWISDDFRALGYKKTIEELSEIAKNSATDKALKSQKKNSTLEIHEYGTSVSAWIPFIPPDSHKNIILIEQAVSIGKFGVLTLVFPAPD